jgi:hypothetical protein
MFGVHYLRGLNGFQDEMAVNPKKWLLIRIKEL